MGFVAQDAPTYAGLSIADHLRFGAHTNPGWDQQLADDRITSLGLDRSQKAGKLSGGQRAQLALTLATPAVPPPMGPWNYAALPIPARTCVR